MQSYELQIYKSGKWEFDSYFDDRGTAISEAERLQAGNRYSGIRVIEERYHPDSDKSQCTVIFSRLKKTSGTGDWRSRAQREAIRNVYREAAGGKKGARANRSGTRRNRPKTRSGARPAVRRRARAKSAGSNMNVYGLMVTALLIILMGLAAMIGLQQIANFL